MLFNSISQIPVQSWRITLCIWMVGQKKNEFSCAECERSRQLSEVGWMNWCLGMPLFPAFGWRGGPRVVAWPACYSPVADAGKRTSCRNDWYHRHAGRRLPKKVTIYFLYILKGLFWGEAVWKDSTHQGLWIKTPRSHISSVAEWTVFHAQTASREVRCERHVYKLSHLEKKKWDYWCGPLNILVLYHPSSKAGN